MPEMRLSDGVGVGLGKNVSGTKRTTFHQVTKNALFALTSTSATAVSPAILGYLFEA
jgi:hypothetical protein